LDAGAYDSSIEIERGNWQAEGVASIILQEMQSEQWTRRLNCRNVLNVLKRRCRIADIIRIVSVFFEILYTVTIVSVIDELNIGHLRYLKLFLHTGISSAWNATENWNGRWQEK